MQPITLSIPLTRQEQAQVPILIGHDLLRSWPEHLPHLHVHQSIAILTDENVAPHWLEPLRQSCAAPPEALILPPGESSKNIRTTQEIWQTLHQAGCDRYSIVFNLGGGVIGDMGGFAASTYMRGVPFVQFPTTLLAMVDASVGGKLAIDFQGAKNLVGLIQQPQAVIIDVNTLQSLPERELCSGFAEILKHALIRDAQHFTALSQMDYKQLTSDQWCTLIHQSCALKAEIVAQDTHEHGLRKLLNFGHTLGHALESLSLESEAPLLHGEAIALGMLLEADISMQMGLLQEHHIDSIALVLKRFSLPTKLPSALKKLRSNMSEQEWGDTLFQKMQSDKKKRGAQLQWTLLQDIGQGIYDVVVPPEHVRASLQRI